MNHTDINTSSLLKPVTKSDILRYHPTQGIAASFYQLLRPLTILAIILTTLCFVALPYSIMTQNQSIPYEIFVPLGVMLAVAGIKLDTARKKVQILTRLNRFASTNNVDLIHDVPDLVRDGMIFHEGRSKLITEGLLFHDGIEIANYKYTTGSGRSRRDYVWGYVRVDLPRPLPHMILDSRENNLFGMSNLPELFEKKQILSLEGDFDKYFTLYAPVQYRTDALYVFTPDVMATLIDHGKQFDIEIIDNNLYLYKSGGFKLEYPATIESVIKITDIIQTEIKHQGMRYVDDRAVQPANSPTQYAIAAPGRRLKRRFNVIATVIVLLVFLYPFIVDALEILLR